MAVTLRHLISWALALACANALALTTADIERIQPGSQLELPVPDSDTPALETIRVDSIATLRDADGGQWYRIDGKRADQQPGIVLLYTAKGSVEVESLTTRLKLRDLQATPKMLWKFDKQGAGALEYEGQHYQFNANESDDTHHTPVQPSGEPTDMSYYRFESAEDDDLALVIFEWSEERFEVLHVGWIDTEQVQLK